MEKVSFHQIYIIIIFFGFIDIFYVKTPFIHIKPGNLCNCLLLLQFAIYARYDSKRPKE